VNQSRKAALAIVAAMATWGTLAPFVRNIDLPSSELALYRALLAIALIGAFLLVTKQRIPFGAIKKEIPLLALSGMAMGFNWILLFEAYRYTTVSVATLSYYFAPVIVTALCPLLFKERLTLRQIVCFAGSTAGLVLVINPAGLEAGGTHHIGVIYGLGAAVLYAFVVLTNKFIKNVDGIHRTFLQFVAAAAVLLPYVAVTSGCHLAGLDAPGWACLLVVGMVHTGVVYCLYFSSLPHVPGQQAAILSYIDPLVAVVVSVLVLGEPLGALQAAGGALILGFTLWNELAGTRKQPVGDQQGEQLPS